jgi:hypothetical protein
VDGKEREMDLSIPLEELWSEAESCMAAVNEAVPSIKDFAVGSVCSAFTAERQWKIFFDPSSVTDPPADLLEASGNSITRLADALPLLVGGPGSVNEFLLASSDSEGFYVEVRSSDPEDAHVKYLYSADDVENFVASRGDGNSHGSAWDEARKRRLVRLDWFGKRNLMEPGTVWFIEWLEAHGAITLWSCEGHPGDFHVTFRAPYELAYSVASLGHATVAVFRTQRLPDMNQWTLRLRSEPESIEERDAKLRGLSEGLAGLADGSFPHAAEGS